MNEEIFEKFYPKLRKTVSGSFIITLRKEVVDALGWSENDLLEVLVKKKD